jgi:hypothetical protein
MGRRWAPAALVGLALFLLPAVSRAENYGDLYLHSLMIYVPSEMHVSARLRGSGGAGIAWPIQIATSTRADGDNLFPTAEDASSFRLVLSPELAFTLPSGEPVRAAFRFRSTVRFVAPLPGSLRFGFQSGVGSALDTTSPPSAALEVGLRFDARPNARQLSFFRYQTVILRGDFHPGQSGPAGRVPSVLTLAYGWTFI